MNDCANSELDTILIILKLEFTLDLDSVEGLTMGCMGRTSIGSRFPEVLRLFFGG